MEGCQRQDRSATARSSRRWARRARGRGTRPCSRPSSARCWSAIPRPCAWCARIRLSALPSNSPVGSRMAIMLGGAAAGAATKLKATLIAIAAHDLGVRRPSARPIATAMSCVARRSSAPPDLGSARRDRASQIPSAAAGHRAGAAGARMSRRCRRAARCRRPTAACRCIPATPSRRMSSMPRSTAITGQTRLGTYVMRP